MNEIIKWNHEQLGHEFSDSLNLNEVIRSVENRYRKSGQVVCSVRVNGIQLSEKDEARFESCPFDEIESLEIAISPIQQLILDSLRSAQEYLRKLETAILSTADLMRGDDLSVATEYFDSVLSGLNNAVELLSQIRSAALGNCIEDTVAFAATWTSCQSDFLDKVQSLVQAFEKRDFILVADILEYDLTKVVENWDEHLRTIGRASEEHIAKLQSPKVIVG